MKKVVSKDDFFYWYESTSNPFPSLSHLQRTLTNRYVEITIW